MKNINIRQADIDDVSDLMRIEESCFVTDGISKRQMRYLLGKARAKTWLCQVNGASVGYAMVFLPDVSRPARLYSLAVMGDFRQMHLASFLLETMLQALVAMGYQRVRLEVRQSQVAVQGLYKKYGFAPLQQIDDYYADGESALRMQRLILREDRENSLE